jgi:hypothetical protein
MAAAAAAVASSSPAASAVEGAVVADGNISIYSALQFDSTAPDIATGIASLRINT